MVKPMNQEVAVSIIVSIVGQGVCPGLGLDPQYRIPSQLCFYLSFSLPLPLKSIKNKQRNKQTLFPFNKLPFLLLPPPGDLHSIAAFTPASVAACTSSLLAVR